MKDILVERVRVAEDAVRRIIMIAGERRARRRACKHTRAPRWGTEAPQVS